MIPVVLIRIFKSDIKRYILAAFIFVLIVLSMPFLAVMSLGEDAVSFLSGTASAKSAEEQGFYMGGTVPGDTYAWGNCTYWVFAMRLWADKPIPTTWGNANTWDDNATLDGYLVNHTPLVTAIMQTDAEALGHVAYVVYVDSETGDWTISEMNAPRFNVVSFRTFSKESAVYYKFIHDKKVDMP
jgi:surface antigen